MSIESFSSYIGQSNRVDESVVSTTLHVLLDENGELVPDKSGNVTLFKDEASVKKHAKMLGVESYFGEVSSKDLARML